MENISLEALGTLGIYELRNVARQVGVYSPTTLKKEELIEKIKAIIQGEEQPHIRKTNQGRPAKQIADLEKIMEIFVPSIEQKSLYQKTVERQSIFGASMMQKINFLPENFEKFTGFVKVLEDNYAVVFKNGYFENNKNTYYITPQLLTKSNVKTGDIVEGLYFVIEENKPNIIKRLTAINGVHGEDMTLPERENFADLDACYPKNQIKLSNRKNAYVDFKIIDKIAPIGEGSRVMIANTNNYYFADFYLDMVKYLSLNYNVTMFSIDDRPEDLSLIKNECVELKVLNKSKDLTIEQHYEFLDICFNAILRQVEGGRNQILIINDLQKMQKFYEKYYILVEGKTEKGAAIEAKEKIIHILNMAKSTQNDKCLTIIVNNVVDEELESLFNCKLIFKDIPYDKTDVYLDCEKSMSTRPNLLLSQKDMQLLTEFRLNLKEDNVIEKLNSLI